MSHRLLKAAVIVPFLGLLGLAVRAEIARLKPTWTVPIAGYDPRDLLHGHYLRYSYRLNWHGSRRCPADRGDCCLCLERDGRGRDNPRVTATSCDEAARCEAWLAASAVRGPRRYLVPESYARRLEAALATQTAAVEITCGPRGEAHIGELLLDGLPWRQALASP